MIRHFAVAALLSVQACDSFVEPYACELPEITATGITPTPTNVLGAVTTVNVQSADSVVVSYFRTGAASDTFSVNTESPDESTDVVLLGLHSSSAYEALAQAYNACGKQTGTRITFSTGALPADLPVYSASGIDPAPGYVAFAAGNYGIVIDNSGRIVWYHRFPNGPGLNFQAQKNGRYLARPPSPPGQPGQWIEIDVLGNVTRTLTCARGLQPRMHDILVKEDGSYWVLCDEVRSIDLSAQGRSTNTPVTGTAVQHISAAGALLFEWSPFDHIEVDLAVLEPADQSGSAVNWTHGNSLDIDDDGNVLVSYRNLDEILKIDFRTGQLLWRLGGARNQFALGNGPARPFRRQHSIRSTGRGEFHLLDNLGEPGASRFERYQYDEVQRVARLVSAHTSSSGAIALTGGTVQHVFGNRTLVSFGSGGNVEEVNEAGQVVWRMNGNPGYVFRAQRINSLHSPGATGEAR